MGTEPLADYCRDIETYLCQKNDGHLIRVVGPAFEMVSRWAAEGIPFKVACRGIDRCFERYHRKGPRRRPVRIDFCEADVLDVFEEWRRAIGLTTAAPSGDQPESDGQEDGAWPRRSGSLPAHLERALLLLTSARATGRLGAAADALVDAVSTELDNARQPAHGLRGAARTTLLSRLELLDRDLLEIGRAQLDPAQLETVGREADQELSPFRAGMTAEAYARSREGAIDRIVRERLGLPTLRF